MQLRAATKPTNANFFRVIRKKVQSIKVVTNNSTRTCSSDLYSLCLLKLPAPPRAALLAYNIDSIFLGKVQIPFMQFTRIPLLQPRWVVWWNLMVFRAHPHQLANISCDPHVSRMKKLIVLQCTPLGESKSFYWRMLMIWNIALWPMALARLIGFLLSLGPAVSTLRKWSLPISSTIDGNIQETWW